MSQIRVGDTLVYTGGRRFTVDKITAAGDYVLLEFVQPAELQRDRVHKSRKAQRLIFTPDCRRVMGDWRLPPTSQDFCFDGDYGGFKTESISKWEGTMTVKTTQAGTAQSSMGPGDLPATKSPALQRERLVALISENVTQLAAADDNWGLVLTLEAVGFHSCLIDDTSEKLAAAIGALSPVLDNETLGFVASSAVFYRWRESCEGEKANAIARAAVEPLGVQFAPCGCFAFIRGFAAACAHCGSMAS